MLHKMYRENSPYFQFQGQSSKHYTADNDGLIEGVESVDRPVLVEMGFKEVDGVLEYGSPETYAPVEEPVSEADVEAAVEAAAEGSEETAAEAQTGDEADAAQGAADAAEGGAVEEEQPPTSRSKSSKR